LACRVCAAKNWRWVRRVGSSAGTKPALASFDASVGAWSPPSERRRSHTIQATGARWKEVRYLSATSRLSKLSPPPWDDGDVVDVDDDDDDDDDDDGA